MLLATQQLADAQQLVKDLEHLERIKKEVPAAAKAFNEKHKLSYKTWRACGVPVAMLKEAGIS